MPARWPRNEELGTTTWKLVDDRGHIWEWWWQLRWFLWKMCQWQRRQVTCMTRSSTHMAWRTGMEKPKKDCVSSSLIFTFYDNSMNLAFWMQQKLFKRFWPTFCFFLLSPMSQRYTSTHFQTTCDCGSCWQPSRQRGPHWSLSKPEKYYDFKFAVI